MPIDKNNGALWTLGAAGVLAVAGLARRGLRGSLGRRFRASEWVDFFAEGNASEQTEDLGQEFSDLVWTEFERWAEEWNAYARQNSVYSRQQNPQDVSIDVSDYNADRVAYNTYASFVGHGVGLWTGELFFEQGVSRDLSYEIGKSLQNYMMSPNRTPKLSTMAMRLDEAIHDDEARAQD